MLARAIGTWRRVTNKLARLSRERSNGDTRRRQFVIVAHLDVVCQFGHVLDDVAVLLWLHLQQLLDHDHRLGNDQLCASARETTKVFISCVATK